MERLHSEMAESHASWRVISRYRGWLAYAAAWLAAAGLWSLAGASSARVPLRETLPYGLLVMSVAAVMGVAVWRLTGYLHWRRSPTLFCAGHALAIVIYAAIYTLGGVIPDVATGNAAKAIDGIRNSPILLWSVLMGSWLYMIVAGISYAIRTDRERAGEAAAASEARLLAQRAQLAALRAQLNPHFLFNALHTVSALVTVDPAAADRALDRLGDLLRYAMADDEMVPLAAEWTFIEDYLAFEQLRLGDRLHVVAEIDPAAADRLVPALILQPLVENAVRHGVSAGAAGGTVRAAAAMDENTLVIRIADDGPGNGLEDGQRNGLGLASVRRRVSAAYRGRGAVDIDNSSGYAVTVRIPCP